MTLRSGGNGYQVAIPTELAEEHDIAIRDDMKVWCNGTSIEIKKHAGQSIPKHTKKTPIESTIFVKTIQPSGKSLVLTLPKQIVKHMGLEGGEESFHTRHGWIHTHRARCQTPGSRFCDALHQNRPRNQHPTTGEQADNPARHVEPFVLKEQTHIQHIGKA